MGTTDESKDVEMLEEMFKDRFTEKDSVYMEIKSKSLSHPTVIYPWRIKKQWNKNWDYSAKRRQDQDHSRSRDNDRNHHRGNSYSNYRDRSNDGESSRHREDYKDRRNSYRRRDDRR